MQTFWDHLNAAKDKFEVEFLEHQQEVEKTLKTYRARIDKSGYTVESV